MSRRIERKGRGRGMIAVGKREGYCCRLHRRNADSDGDDDESLKHSKSFMMSRSIGNRTQAYGASFLSH